jgi:ABC-type phosphate transport system substrate-binding protein
LKDGFAFDPIEVQVWPDPDNPAKIRYRILDGRHRWGAYKKTGATFIDVVIITLDQMEPILYAAQKAIGPIGYINWGFPRTGLPKGWR